MSHLLQWYSGTVFVDEVGWPLALNIVVKLRSENGLHDVHEALYFPVGNACLP